MQETGANPFWAGNNNKKSKEDLSAFCMAYLTLVVKRNDDIKKRFSSFSLLCTRVGLGTH